MLHKGGYRQVTALVYSIQEGEPRKPQILNIMEWMAISSYQCEILMMFDIKIIYAFVYAKFVYAKMG